MARYLIRKTARSLDMTKAIPKGTIIQRSSKGIRVKTKTKTGVWLKGFKVVRAKSQKSALRKTYPKIARKYLGI